MMDHLNNNTYVASQGLIYTVYLYSVHTIQHSFDSVMKRTEETGLELF